MAGVRKSRMGPERSSAEPFREKSGTISKRLVYVHLAAKWFSFFDNKKNISLVMNFPENDELSDNRIASEGPTLPLDHSWMNRFENKLKELEYHDLQKKNLNDSTKRDNFSSSSSSDMIGSSDTVCQSQDTCLAEDSASSSTSLPSTSLASSPDPLANMLIHIDGQDINTKDPDQISQFLTDLYSALVNLVDHMHTRHLSEIENAECKLCLAYLILSFSRLVEPPVKTAVNQPHQILTSGHTADGSGMPHEDYSDEWLSEFVTFAERNISDNKITQVSIGADRPWKAYSGLIQQSDKATAHTSMLAALDRIRMTLEDKFSPALGYYKCNQILIQEIRSGQDLWPAKLCTAKFIRLQDLALHLAKFHDVPSVKKYARHNDCIYHCALCIGKQQDNVYQLDALVKHLKKVHIQDALACPFPECKSRFVFVGSLKGHMTSCPKRRHASDVYPCSSKLCSRSFNSFDDYRKHMVEEHKYCICVCSQNLGSEKKYWEHKKASCTGKPDRKRKRSSRTAAERN